MVEQCGFDAICFVICPIGDEGSETRKRSDQVLRHIIEPATVPHGLEAVRSDKIEQTRLISHAIVEHICKAKLVIADLTEWNPNVFYELALRHALQLPYVQLMAEGERLPFDVKDVNTIPYTLTDPDALERAREKLSSHVASAISPNATVETPFSVAIDLIRLRESGDQGKIDYANLVAEMGELRQGFRELQSSIGLLAQQRRAAILTRRGTVVDGSPVRSQFASVMGFGDSDIVSISPVLGDWDYQIAVKDGSVFVVAMDSSTGDMTRVEPLTRSESKEDNNEGSEH